MFRRYKGPKKVIIKDEKHGNFDSRPEYEYYFTLLELKKEGFIKSIERQKPRFDYPNASTCSDRGGYYLPDFYVVDWKDREHIIDIKGRLEDASRIKIAYIEYIYGVTIKVVPDRNTKKNKKWTYRAMDTSFITEEDNLDDDN